jgi:hypothetical protein
MTTDQYVTALAEQCKTAAMREVPKGIQHETSALVIATVRDLLMDELKLIAERARS